MKSPPLPKSSRAFNRQSVQEALRSLRQRLSLYKKTPPNGLALFCGYHVTEAGKERKLLVAIEPLAPLVHSLYKCDSQFHTELLREQLNQGGKFGFIVIDGHGCSFHILAGDTRSTIYKWDNVALPKKHGRGGQSQNRFARIREEKRFNYITKVVALATQHFIDPLTNGAIVESIVMAGLADFKSELGKRLDPRLQKLILTYVDVAYNGEQGFNQAIQLAAGALKDCKFLRDQKTLEGFFFQISSDAPYCFTSSDTVYALEAGAVETLVVWEELPDMRYSLHSSVDPSVKKLIYSTNGLPTEIQDEPDWVIESQPLLDWILENYRSFGASLCLVADSSTVGNQFVKGFGGIGAFLRFPVDVTQKDDEEGAEAADGSDEYDFVY